MKGNRKYRISKRVTTWEAVAFTGAILVVWLNELIDTPNFLFGAERTPVNWIESIVESVLIAILGGAIIYITHRLFKRMKYLEGILPVCASCKRIRDEQNRWQPIESYIRDRSEAEFSHGICPDCALKLYPEYYKEDK